MRVALLLACVVGVASAAPDAHELGARGRDWLARQVTAGEVSKHGPVMQAQVLRAFATRGFTHRAGPYKRQVNALRTALMDVDPGTLEPLARAELAWALAEIYQASKDRRVQPVLERATQALGEALTPGGLPRTAGGAPDAEATLVAAFALRSARRAGAKPPPGVELGECLTELAAASDQPRVAAGYPGAAYATGVPGSKLRKALEAGPAPAELDLRGCYWAAHSQRQVAGKRAVTPPALVERVAELTVAGGGADAGAAKSAGAERIGDTAFAVLCLNVATRHRDEEWVSAEALQALPAVAEAEDPRVVTLMLQAAGGQLYEKGTAEGQAYVNQHATARLALAQLLAAEEGPASGFRAKGKAALLLRNCRAALGPETLKVLSDYLATCPPAEVAVDLGYRLANELKLGEQLKAGDSYEARLEFAKRVQAKLAGR